MTWQVDFYEEEDGSAPVEAFLSGLPVRHRAKALAIVRLLEERGAALPYPYSSRVKGKIRELRTQYAKDKIRILYFGDTKRRFVLLHGLVKRIEKLSGEDIQIADKRMQKHNKKQERS